MEREVTLLEILEARERRVARQQELLGRYGGPLISFTMNIAGPVKDSPLIRRAFGAGCRQLKAALESAALPVRCWEEECSAVGCQLYCAVEGDPLAVKRICAGIEDASSLGRLFDMDVLHTDGTKLDREQVGGGDRSCIVCGAPGRGCASRRIHTVAQLQEATRRIMTDYFAAADEKSVAELAAGALTDEVNTTPKPGLVDRANSGSHGDMDVGTFERSIAALAPYWERCAQIGRETAGQTLEETFALLRRAGLEAEEAMLRATGGVNTHKGAVFTLGTVCGAIGRLWRPEAPCRDVDRILKECAAMTAAAVEADWARLAETPAHKLTVGQRLYREMGLPGIRGEVAGGLPGVAGTALPAFRGALDTGRSRNDAGAIALLYLIARGTDTNMIARGGPETARAAEEEVRELLKRDPMPPMEEIARLDRDFIRKNLSPGGCADLLAVTYFLHDWCGKQDE